MLKRQWIAAGAAILCVTLGYGLTLAVVGIDDSLYYHREVMSDNVAVYGPYPLNVALPGVFHRTFTDGPWVQPLVADSRLAFSCITLTSVVVVVPLLRQRSDMPCAGDESYALACIAMLLISPITWGHIFPVLWLPFGLVIGHWQLTRDRTVALLGLPSVILVSLLNLPIARALMHYYAPYRMPWYASLALLGPTLGLLILWGLLVRRNKQDATKMYLFEQNSQYSRSPYPCILTDCVAGSIMFVTHYKVRSAERVLPLQIMAEC